MKISKLTLLAALGAGALFCHTLPALAQEEAAAPPPPPSPEGPGPLLEGAAAASAAPAAPGTAARPATNVDRMEQFRQRINERIKGTMQASDQEWGVIQPMLNTVQDKVRESMISRFGGLASRPNRGPGSGPGSTTGGTAAKPDAAPAHPGGPTVAEAQAALRTCLETEGTSNTEIKAKLEALRDAHKRSEADLAKARADLKSVLSLRQEATLVMMGMLD